MKTRRQLAEEIGMNFFYMNEILCKAQIQVRLGSCYCFMWPYATEEFEREVRTVDKETGRLERETYLTPTGEELIKEALENVCKNSGSIDDPACFIRNRWGRRIYQWKRRTYLCNPSFYDCNPDSLACKA